MLFWCKKNYLSKSWEIAPKKKKFWEIDQKNTKKKENVFSIFSSRMVFPEFFFSKNAFGPHFPPTSPPYRFWHFYGHFHVFWLFLKVLGLRSRVSSHEMTIFWFQNGSDHQKHHFQPLFSSKQSQNRKKLEITRIAIRFSAKTGWSHGTGVPLRFRPLSSSSWSKP